MKRTVFSLSLILMSFVPACAGQIPEKGNKGENDVVEIEYGARDVKSLFQVTAKYDNHPMQAMCIHDDVLFQCYDSGRCRTYNFKTGKPIGEMFMDCLVATNHCGNANFGKEYPVGNTVFPALYISGDLTEKCCYVLTVNEIATIRIQTIRFELSNNYGGSQVIIDKERNRIVYMQRKLKDISAKDNTFAIFEFPLPKLKDGNVTFKDEDVLDSYELDTYLPVYQGACIRKGKIYQSYGTGKSSAGIAVFDLKTHKMEKRISVKDVIPYEPQSACVYNNKLIMNFGGAGLIYEIKDVL